MDLNPKTSQVNVTTYAAEQLANDLDEDIVTIEKIQQSIRRHEAFIEKLNKATFQDPNTRQRPPTEYLEVYNTYTEQIHQLQMQMNQVAALRSRTKGMMPSKSASQDVPEPAMLAPPTSYLGASSQLSDTDESSSSPRSPVPPAGSSKPSKRLQHFHSFDEAKTLSLLASPALPLEGHQQTLMTQSKTNLSLMQTGGGGASQSAFSFPSMHPSSYVKVFFGSNSAVVQKKNMTLKDALASKLKRFNLEASKSVAYEKETNQKVDWDTKMVDIEATNLVVAELNEDVKHTFEKKTFTWRTCSSCKKRDLLNLYVCTKCELIMCQKDDCRVRTERIICIHRKTFRTQTSSFGLADAEKKNKNMRSNSVQRDLNVRTNQYPSSSNPTPKKPVMLAARDRSHSETYMSFNSVHDKMSLGVKSLKNDSAYASAVSGIKNFNSGDVFSRDEISYLSSPEHTLKAPATSVLPRKAEQDKRLTKKQLSLPSRRDSFMSWEIPFTQINIDLNHKVGQGSFGIVHQGKDFYHGKVAIKFLNVQTPTPAQREAFKNEVVILKLTRHDNILLFIGCILKPYLAIVTEWCSGSSLYRHLHVEEVHWDIGQLINIAKQTTAGMSYLHGRDILHRDLKSNNIFLIPKERPTYQGAAKQGPKLNRLRGLDFDDDDDDQHRFEKWTVKIGDFGLATVKANWDQAQLKSAQPTGSILWMAPEVITQKLPDPYTQKSDVYSFAVVLYELFTGHLPYLRKEQNMILFLVGSGRLKPSPDDVRPDTPTEIKNLISTCSEYDRSKRLNFCDVNKILLKFKFYDHKLKRRASMPNLDYHHHSY